MLRKALDKELDETAPISMLGNKLWQRLYAMRLAQLPLNQRSQAQRDLVMLLSDPDSGVRMERLSQFFLLSED
jgi:hypothetical protein